MAKDYEGSLGGEKTFQGQNKPKADDLDTRSLGDQATFAGGKPVARDQSLGDQMTYGGGAGDGDLVDDGMEVVDLSARYKIEKTLGKGGMGEVLLATDLRLERKVAIKRILGEATRSRSARQRFLTGAKTLAGLSHPNIVQVYEYGQAMDGPYMALELVNGGSLLDRCKQGPIELEEAIDIACQLCDGLAKAHRAGVIHRDIKPGNILLTEDGIPKLNDFDLAKAESADTGMTMAGAVLGTLDFMPPEQRQDASLTDARSDLWSLAATLYQMVTGKSPKIIRLNDVPNTLQEVLGKALEENKEERYQTAQEFKQALKLALTNSAELHVETGECPHCATRNDASRKFCKKCAQSLEVGCLSCKSKIPMWEEVCGNCGTQQSGLLEQRKQAMVASRAEAEQLLEELEFDKATQLATKLGQEPDLRLRQLRGWSEKFLQQVQASQKEQYERVGGLVAEALKHQAAHDYPAAIHTLEQIPAPLRSLMLSGQSETVAELLEAAEGKLREVKRLERLIKERIESRQLNGLLAEVEKLLGLRPDKADALKLKNQLLEREAKLRKTRDEAFAAAKKLYADNQFEAALRELSRIDESVFESPQAALRSELQTKLEEINQLQEQVNAALAAKKYSGLLAMVESLLELQPKDAAMQKLREQLLAREAKNEAAVQETVEKAEQLRNRADFTGAVNLLSRVPEELVTIASHDLLEECAELGDLQQGAVQGLELALRNRDFKAALVGAAAYGERLNATGIQDPAFVQLYQQAKAGLAEQKRQEERRQQTAKVIKMGAIAAASVALLVGSIFAYLSISASMRTAALKTALEQQQWETVLKMEPENVTALIGRAASRFMKNPPEFETGFADLSKAEELDSSAAGLKSTKATGHAKRANTLAAAGKTAEAEKDFSQAKVLGAAATELDSTAGLLAAAYVKEAEQLVRTGNASQVTGKMTKALEYDQAVSAPAAVLELFADSAVKAFEQAATDANLTAARGAIDKLESAPKTGYYRRLGQVLLTRGRKLISTDTAQGFKDLDLALDFGVPEADTLPLKTELAAAAKTALDQKLVGGNLDELLSAYGTLSAIDASAGAEYAPRIMERVSPEDLIKLPAEVITSLPPIKNSVGVELRLLPAGEFTMGYGDQTPHEVTLTRPFYLGVYEVTQEQYERVMGKNPSHFKGAQNPVEQVSWEDAVEFCRKLSALPEEKAAGRVYRLPTEAEWEYACRAGSRTKYCFGDSESELGEYGWFDKNSGSKTHPVGQKKPNAWRLYDMHGNVWEWCNDWYSDFPKGAATDPVGPATGSVRVFRGGSWYDRAAFCRSAFRYWCDPSFRFYFYGGLGFRVALSSPGIPK